MSTRRQFLAGLSRRLVIARRWAQTHPDDYARVLAAEIGVTQAVARLVFDTEIPVPIAIDARVIADEQKTADRYLAAGIIHERLDANKLFDASFNAALTG